MPFLRTVFGDLPVPQMVNDPKSLYQSPSGAQGSVRTQIRSRWRSSTVIARSATRSRMCSQSGRGRLTKRIFGNRVAPEDCPDQILAGLAFPDGISLPHEFLIGAREPGPRGRFGFYAPFGKSDQGAAHRHISHLRHAPDFPRELRRNRHTLTDGRSRHSNRWFASGWHDLIILHLHHCGAP